MKVRVKALEKFLAPLAVRTHISVKHSLLQLDSSERIVYVVPRRH